MPVSALNGSALFDSAVHEGRVYNDWHPSTTILLSSMGVPFSYPLGDQVRFVPDGAVYIFAVWWALCAMSGTSVSTPSSVAEVTHMAYIVCIVRMQSVHSVSEVPYPTLSH